MKVTRKQLRRIIREEAKRPFPIDYYPDEMLMQEGLWDAISNFLGAIIGFFTDAWGEAEGNVNSAFKGYRKEWQSGNWKALVKDLDPKGKGDPPDPSDVDYTNEKWAPAFWGGMMAQEAFDQVMKAYNLINKANSSVPADGWLPKEGEDPKEWIAGPGKDVLNINKAFGMIIAIVNELALGTPELQGVGDKLRALNPEDAGAAAQGIKDALTAIANSSAKSRAEASAKMDVWGELPYTGEPETYFGALKDMIDAVGLTIDLVKDAAEAQAEAIEAAETEGSEDSKEEANEWVMLRRHVNAMIIQERRRRT